MTNFGISIFGERPDHVVELGRLADELGFSRLQIGDHIVGPENVESRRPYRPGAEKSKAIGPNTLLFDAFSMLGALSTATNDVVLQTGVLVAPLRHPLAIAQAAATLQHLAGGRFELGLGAGWCAEEFAALDMPFADRGSRLEETVDIVRRAIEGGPFSHTGRHFTFDPLAISTVKVDVPVILGGTTEPALRRVARLADGWFNPPVPVDDCLRMRDDIERYRAAEGNAARPFRYYIQLKSADGSEVDRYVAEGFTNLTILSHRLWKQGVGVELSEKSAMLRVAAERLDVRASVR